MNPALSRTVLGAFFVSGVAGLMHQVVWSKLLVGLIGATAHAQATVLAVFMGGLALGAVIFGRRVDRRGRPLGSYVALELLIAGYCLLLPLLLKLAGALYIGMAPAAFESPALRLLLRLALATVCVLPPALMMGGTLPLLARRLVGELHETRRQVARLYALNSLGAVLGAGVAGFVALPLLGVLLSLVAASLLNVVAGAMLFREAREERNEARPVLDGAGRRGATAASYRPDQYAVTLVALALSGFAAMGYEVLFTRVIALSFGLSTFSFTVMLMTFITGISLGAGIVSRIKVVRPLWLLGLSQLAVVVAMLLVTPLISRLPYYAGLMRIRLADATLGFELYQLGKAGLCLALLLLPTTCLGIAFPLVAEVQARRSPRFGSAVGSTYAWNTVGNVLGALVTSLLLLPVLGLLGAFHFNFALNLLAGLALLFVAGEVTRARRLAATVGVAAIVAVYAFSGTGWLQPINLSRNHLRMQAPAAGDDPSTLAHHPSKSFENWKRSYVADEAAASHFFFGEDSHSTILAYGDFKQIVLHVNSKPDASTNRDLPPQMFLAHFPLFLTERPRSVLVIGYGSGITAGSALCHPVEHVDAVEISRAVLDADPLFAEFNHGALGDPRLTIHEDDAQSFLGATPAKYDVIISQPSNPWIAGLASLYTVEFFEGVREQLNPGGKATIWFHEYEQSREAVELVLRTLRSVFPHVELFRTHDYSDIIAVASVDAFEVDFAALEDRFDHQAVRDDLARVGIANLAALLMHHSISRERLETLLPAGPLNTMERPRLEYQAPRNFFSRAHSDLLLESDPLLHDPTARDTLLAAYTEYRSRRGEPLSREELGDVAGAARFLGGRGELVARAIEGLAQRAPHAMRPPSRPARGRPATPEEMGLFEANYWARRLQAQGDVPSAERYARRVQALLEPQ